MSNTARTEDSLKPFYTPARWARMEERAEARRAAQSDECDWPQMYDEVLDNPALG